MPRRVRDYRDEYDSYQSKPEQKKRRAKRNAARAIMEKEKGKSALRGKDVDHKHALSKGGSNSRSNLHAISCGKNRSYKRNKDGSMA